MNPKHKTNSILQPKNISLNISDPSFKLWALCR